MDMFMDKLSNNKLTAQEMMDANVAAEKEEQKRLKAQVAEYRACLDQLQKIMEGGTAADVSVSGEAGAQLDTKVLEINDGVHKEGVKVYRNVQACVVGESKKQTETIQNTVRESAGAIDKVYKVSVCALIFSLASVVLQILNVLHIL